MRWALILDRVGVGMIKNVVQCESLRNSRWTHTSHIPLSQKLTHLLTILLHMRNSGRDARRALARQLKQANSLVSSMLDCSLVDNM